MYYALCLSLGLATLGLIATAGSGVVAVAGGRLARSVAGWPTALTAEILFLTRMLPSLGALQVTLLVVVPGFLIFEPRPSGEDINLQLGVLASLGSLMLGVVVIRGARLLLASRRIRREWLRDSVPLAVPGTKVPCHRLAKPGGILALSGFLWPRIFVSAEIVETLSEAELAAAVRHELAHVSAADNLKQFLLRISRLPGLGNRFAELDRSWLASCEISADQEATSGGADALDFAAALVKVSRLKMELRYPVDPVASHLNPAGAESLLPARIQGIRDRMNGPAAGRSPEIAARRAVWFCFLTLLCASSNLLTHPAVLSRAHQLLELLVQ